ncbi:MAG: PfkB family carbohydrate kinase [Planctomycetota bacterium]
MALLVVGTVAYDSVETPAGRAEEVLGGAATYFSYAASFFCPVRLMGVVGEDFRDEDRSVLEERSIDLRGLLGAPGRTFRWSGRYEGDCNVAETVQTQLNVWEHYDPQIPEPFRDSRFLFLANQPPAVQAKVVDQAAPGAFIVMDTMDFWIRNTVDDLRAVLRRVDGVTINDTEARMLTGEPTLIRAGRAILDLGPRLVVLKKGEHGSFLFSPELFFALPAYPVADLRDPTGAGDTFAGGLMGFLAHAGEIDEPNLKRAMVYGTVLSSCNVEGFSLEGLRRTTRERIEVRYRELLRFTAVP